MHDHETQGHPYMSPHVSPRAGIRNRSSPIVSSSPSSVISLSSSDSEPEDIDVDAMSSSSFPPSPPLTRPDPSVAPPIVDAQLLEEHAEHFHPGGDVKILVGRTLYQLHADVLARQSRWYRSYRDALNDESMLPPGWHAQPGPFCTVYVHHGKERVQFERPGAVDEQTGAIVVEDITSWTMDVFLAVLYPTDFISFGLTGQEEWTAVLKVAHAWDCPAIRTLAIQRLDRELGDPGLLDKSFDRLVLARKYAVEPWAKLGLHGLVARKTPLDAEEIEHMLPEDVAHVAAMREDRALRESPSCSSIPVPLATAPPVVICGSSQPLKCGRPTTMVPPPTSASPQQHHTIYAPPPLPSPSSWPSPQTPRSPALSILRAPSPRAVETPVYTSSSSASSPQESTRSITPFCPWAPPPAPGSPRAWSTTPTSNPFRETTLVDVRSPSPPPPPMPASLWDDAPASSPAGPSVFSSPPPLQVPTTAPSPPRAPMLMASPGTSFGAGIAKQPKRTPVRPPPLRTPMNGARSGLFVTASSRPASMVWTREPPPWAVPGIPAGAGATWMTEPTPAPLQTSHPPPVPKSTYTLF